ncbi:MAG: DNA gyrase inhibitor YacG [Acidobacteriia bacterium]|nr:DNA gyrase inhibitor YacG [Terriglobia bacterium]
MQCPICRKEVPSDSPFIPFCSDRCRIIDLGNWASEKYMISTPVDTQTLEEIPDQELEDDSE